MGDPVSLGLGIASFTLAVPGTIIAFAHCGEYIKTKIHNYRHASAVLQELKTIGHELHEGELKKDLEIAHHAFGSYDDSIKKSLDARINGLAAQLSIAKQYVDDVCTHGILDRIAFTLIRERRGRKINEGIKEWQEGFVRSALLHQIHQQFVPNEHYLNIRRLVNIEDARSLGAQPDGPNTYTSLLIGRCEYRAWDADPAAKNMKEIDVLFERYTGPQASKEQVEAIAKHLARSLHNSAQSGVLHCLGFRDTPHIELCFELPEGHKRIVPLAERLSDLADAQPILDAKFALARSLSKAVFSVAATGFVHKSIRSGTVMLLSPETTINTGSGNDVGRPFLTTWQYMRKEGDLSKRENPAEDWQEDIYRHPHRHGIRAQARYNTGHDIYSLGVCLLEIGLWNPLLTYNTTTKEVDPAAYFVEAAATLLNVAPAHFDIMAAFRRPSDIQQVLFNLAAERLPSQMGMDYARLVTQCLTCLEGGFGDENDFSKMSSVEAGLFLNDFMLGSFPGLGSP